MEKKEKIEEVLKSIKDIKSVAEEIMKENMVAMKYLQDK